MATQTHPTAQQLTVPLSAIAVADGFNPRSDVERAELARLARSIEQHGLIQPLVVTPHGEGYGLPGWALEEQRKDGTTKAVYLDRQGSEAKAREFLSGGKSAAETAGRQVVLLAMARYADEQAVAQSQRSFYPLAPGGQLPWSDEAIDQLDAIAAEKLPAHVLDRGREQREDQAAERAKDREDRAWLAEQYAGLATMTPEQRQAVLAEHEQRFGHWGGQRWQLEQRIRELAQVEPTAEEPTASKDEDGEDAA